MTVAERSNYPLTSRRRNPARPACFPDFLTFLANNAAIGVVALVAWVAIVGIVVWLGEKAVQKFRQRRSRTATPADASASNSVTTLKPATGEQATAGRKPGAKPEAAE